MPLGDFPEGRATTPFPDAALLNNPPAADQLQPRAPACARPRRRLQPLQTTAPAFVDGCASG
jgi:hypothetical protein